MKKIFITLAILTFSYCSFAQNTFPATGNVGIGTTTPNAPLHLYGTGDVGLAVESSINAPYLAFRKAAANKWILVLERNTPSYGMAANDIGFLKGGATIPSLMIQQSTGYVGIGYSSPVCQLSVNAQSNTGAAASLLHGQYYGISVSSEQSAAPYYVMDVRGGTTSAGGSGNSLFYVRADGNIGVGTASPDQKLTVNGTIHSKAVVVDVNIFPDFVFKPTYQLPTLTEVKTYIDKNQHLPDVPAAAEVEKNGLNLGEMNATLLKKVEELTLYLIEQNKQLKALQKEVEQLKNK